MNRRKFLLSAATLGLGGLAYYHLETTMEGAAPDTEIRTLTIDGLKVHAIPTGSVAVKRSHRGPGIGIVQILADFRWTEYLPIYTWVIEHPEGILLIDTGENARAGGPDYFACDPQMGFVYHKILRLQVAPQQEIIPQLQSIGIQAEDVRWVVQTHLHLDHMDGLSGFPKSEILISQTEYQHPSGAVMCLLPNWLKPHLLAFKAQNDPIFGSSYPLTKAGDIRIVPTPGHTYGHQSVILQTASVDFIFAGDTSFSDKQLLQGKIAGISADKSAARQTYANILRYCSEKPTVYLPSHDVASGKRMEERQVLYQPYWSNSFGSCLFK